MRKILLSACLLFIFACLANSQDTIVVLHPSVGDMIDRYEKIKYDLLPEFKDSRFEYAVIQKENGLLVLNIKMFPDSLIERPMDTIEFNRLNRKIELVSSANPSSEQNGVYPAKSIVIIHNNDGVVNKTVVNDETREQISSETMASERLRDDADRRKLQQQGSNVDNNGLLIDFSYMKKKRKN